jgi:AN1-type zinc finger protein 5/6
MMSKKPVKNNSCKICGKIVGIFGFDCRCEHIFCTKHRIPESHNCTYDFKENGKLFLQNTMVKVTKNKIENI